MIRRSLMRNKKVRNIITAALVAGLVMTSNVTAFADTLDEPADAAATEQQDDTSADDTSSTGDTSDAAAADDTAAADDSSDDTREAADDASTADAADDVTDGADDEADDDRGTEKEDEDKEKEDEEKGNEEAASTMNVVVTFEKMKESGVTSVLTELLADGASADTRMATESFFWGELPESENYAIGITPVLADGYDAANLSYEISYERGAGALYCTVTFTYKEKE